MSVDANPPAGVPNQAAVQKSMRDAAQKAKELQHQAEAARASLGEAAAKVQEVERQAAAAQKTIMSYQEHESIFARALEEAQRASDEVIQAANARAEEAQRASDEIVEAANARAEEAQRASDEIVEAANARGAEMVTSAKATAEAIIRSARNTAADTVHKARESAQEQLEAAERTAAERGALLGSESTEVGGAVNPNIAKTKKATEQYLTGIVTKLDAFIHDRERVSQSLEALAKSHAESLQTMTRVKTEVQKEILPVMQRLLRGLKGEGAGERRDRAPDAARNATENDADIALENEALGPLVLAPSKPERPAAPDRPARETAHAAAGKNSGEIVVSPIHSFMQATRFISALTQVKGVASVKLRNYAGARLTIDVQTDGEPIGAIDCTLIDGFPIEVVESADNQLVLRIGPPAGRPTAR